MMPPAGSPVSPLNLSLRSSPETPRSTSGSSIASTEYSANFIDSPLRLERYHQRRRYRQRRRYEFPSIFELITRMAALYGLFSFVSNHYSALSSTAASATSAFQRNLFQEGIDFERQEIREENALDLPPMSKVVISMSLCVSQEAQQAVFLRTANKPYDKALLLSTRLWLQQQHSGVDIDVLVSLVNKRNDIVGLAEMARLEKLLSEAGATVWNYTYDGSGDENRGCVYGSQLARAFAHEISLFHEDDWIVTSDVDVFPLNGTEILRPILENNQNAEGGDYVAFVSSHDRTLANLDWVGTHLMTYTALKQKHWREMWNVSNLSLVAAIDAAIQDHQWTADQALVTAALANAEYCTFPNAKHKFYKRCKNFLLKSPEEMARVNDTLTCNKGKDMREGAWCTGKMNEETPGKCRWLHFESDANETLFQMHYNMILKG